MFTNSFQNGPHFEIFDPKDAQNKANKEKEKFYQALYKQSTNQVEKVFDKQLKNYIFEMQGHNTRISFPREGDLGLIQQFLVVQLFVPLTQQWTLEFSLTDTSKTKRHVYLTQSCKVIEKKPFHVRYPYEVPKNCWLNLQIDLYSFMSGWKGQTFRSLDILIIQAPCKVRKVFTMKQSDPDGSLIPKTLGFPVGIEHENIIVQYTDNFDASIDSCQMKITSKKVTGFSQKSQQQQQKQTQEKIVRSNIVYDDHPTPKKNIQGSMKEIQESNEFLVIKPRVPSNKTMLSNKKTLDRSAQRVKNTPKQHNRLAASVPKKQQKQQEQEEYQIRTQKFTNDQFKDLANTNADEIEECIEIGEPSQQQQQQQQELIEESFKKIITANNFNKRSISELKNDSKLNESPDIEDSLETPFKSVTAFAQEGFYANQLKKYTDLARPFTPEYAVQFQFQQK